MIDYERVHFAPAARLKPIGALRGASRANRAWMEVSVSALNASPKHQLAAFKAIKEWLGV